MKKFKALIIGAGNIGAFFDDPKSEHILTHAHAYVSHSGFELAGFVDSDLAKAKKAAKIWGGNAYSDIEDAFEAEPSIDVISVCVPDNFHFVVIQQILEKPAKLIFAEKPITQSVVEAEEVIRLAREKNISIEVNYSRRFVPEFMELAKEIKSKKYGNFLTGNGYYGKGVMHNGSHLIDLIRTLVGEISEVDPIAKEIDFYKDDQSVSAALKMKNGKNITLLYILSTKFTIFELDLLFDKGRIQIRDSGNLIEISRVEESGTFKGYNYLVSDQKITTSLNRAIYFAADNIFNYLDRGDAIVCNGEEGRSNLKNAIKIRESVK